MGLQGLPRDVNDHLTSNHRTFKSRGVGIPLLVREFTHESHRHRLNKCGNGNSQLQAVRTLDSTYNVGSGWRRKHITGILGDAEATFGIYSNPNSHYHGKPY